MQSFRNELEDINNPVVAKDIIDLENKIKLFKDGQLDEDKFRSLRLARGVYGQRQPGVQMIRIKIPYGRLTTNQLLRISDVSDEFSTGKLHATTRQDIQIHYVSLDRTPELWAQLEKDQVTLREACGNTVRNITASAKAGVDPDEAFDVSPYAQATFEYLLRNPFCQEMGRKIKIAFSSSDADTALTFIHDLGFIPRVKIVDGEEVRGFKVLIAGGLGAIPHFAEVASEFLEEDQLIPFTEAVLRVFDRYGERAKRQKARMKFLIKELGLDALLELAAEEQKALQYKTYKIDRNLVPQAQSAPVQEFKIVEITNQNQYKNWLATNVFEQKQKGFYGVFIKLPLGNMSTKTARKLVEITRKYAADDIRVTIDQNYMLKFVRKEALTSLFLELDALNLAIPGYDGLADITSCPGTDTCNLGISSSTGNAVKLEELIHNEFPELIHDNQLKIKISGCPNACGQHTIASIGFHGSSQRNGKLVLPALQVLLGGGVLKGGEGVAAEKIIKVPSKRSLDVLRIVLADYEENQLEGEYYTDYYKRHGKMYFYKLLKPLTDLTTLKDEDYLDWGHEEKFAIQRAVGECAGVIIDLVATLIYETEEKYAWALESYQNEHYSDAIYHAYSVFINGAKALLLSEGVKTNSQNSVMTKFDEHFAENKAFEFDENFRTHVLQIKENEPTKEFAEKYIQWAENFLNDVKATRSKQVNVA